MKKTFIFFTALVLMFSFAPSISAANSITSRLKGKLLLQVQDKGRVWYVDPVGLQKHEVTFANALSLFQKLALGITNADLIKIPADLDSISSSQDSDGDGYTDRAELQSGFSPYIAGSNQGRFKTDNNLAKKLKGRLLLQVQDKGRIWYIDQNGKRWEVTWGNLMSLFRKLALGITDKDLGQVGGGFVYQDSKYNFSLSLPSGWSDYKVSYRTSDWGLNGKTEGVVFGVQEQDSIFTITIHTQDQWTKISAEDGPKPKYINEHNGYIYGYSVAQEALSERVGELAQNIPNIISSFKFTEETANWQTYKNSEYGFEFKYPKDWKMIGGGQTICEGDCFNKDNIQITKVAYGVNADGSVNDRNSYLERFASGGYLKISVIGGKGYYDVNETKGGSSPEIYLVGDEEIFLMNFNIFDSSKTSLLEAEKLFKQIISTFEFLETENNSGNDEGAG